MQPVPQSFQLQEYQSLNPGSTTRVPSPQRTIRSHWEQFYWTLEILSCIIAALILVALVALLEQYDERQQPNWPRPISINTIISIFTVAFKALLLKPVVEGLSQSKWLWFSRPKELSDLELLDQASRGPWGSACLLFDSLTKSKWRTSYLAIFGAILSIVALAVDPFSQGIVHYYSCEVSSPERLARIPLVHNYSAAGKYDIDPAMAVAIYTGLINPPNSSTTSISCPTGNCTFPGNDGGPTFSSLAMCHTCEDITSTVTSETILTNVTKWSLPSGLEVFGLSFFNATTAGMESPSFWAFEALMLSCPRKQSENGTDDDASCPSIAPSTTIPFAVRCGLEPCVKTYNANVSRSHYRETCLKTERFNFYWWQVTNKTLQNGRWEDCNPSKEKTDANTFKYYPYLSADDTTSNHSHGESLWYPPKCVWSFGFNVGKAIGNFLGLRWQSKVTSSKYSATPEGDIWLTNLYRKGKANLSTVNSFMEGLSLAITSEMRQSPDDPDTLPYVAGTAKESVTCVRVRWAWLLYPISALCLTIVFLSLAIFQGRATHQPWHNDWKSSSLALLFHGLEPEVRNACGAVPKQKDMMKASEQIRVQLVEGERGWRFSEARQPTDEEDEMATRVSAEARPDTTSLNALGRPSLRVSQTSTASLLAPSVSYDSAISTPRSQSPQASPRRSTTI